MPSKLSIPKFLALLLGFYVLLSYFQRLIYVAWNLIIGVGLPEGLLPALSKGLLFDLAAAAYLFAPITLFLILLPPRWRQRRWFRVTALILTLVPLVIASFAALGEIFFFEEFHARYNFIAVDYLIYTTEVISNVLESYSPWLIALGILVPALAYVVILKRWLWRLNTESLFQSLGKGLTVGILSTLVCAATVSENRLISTDAYWPRELSKNSLFTIFSAYHHNSINFAEFYATLPLPEALQLARSQMHGRSTDEASLTRDIKGLAPERPLNVVMVVMESMSAAFMVHFGNRVAITPNLDKLADASLFLTRLYATGTRTVRGLEALMLSLPPTPGQSILRRPGSDQLFNLGTVFSERGYQTQFIYGGYAYFDNMQEWFEGNGFEVVDRASFPASEIQFGNAWGVCDEDLFHQVLKQQQLSVDAGKRFFQVVLTTSNHRPYTFPEGRIDMPSHSGREAALKYSDYAIGKFIDDAKTKPWFKDTLFVFVADHNASVAGGTDIPVHDYLIPVIFYQPGLIVPLKLDKLASQIDVAPTLLGLLNFSYTSKFMGEDLIRNSPERALLGTYQKVARLEGKSMTVLAPGHWVETQTLDGNYVLKKSTSVVAHETRSLPEAARAAIAFYQAASELFVSGQLHVPLKTSAAPHDH